jgi:hypothetical protein
MGDGPADLLQRLWDEGKRPNLAEFLATAGDLPSEQLAEVVRVDQRQRWQNGNPVSVESYFARYPLLRDHAELAVDLIYQELLLRERQGEGPDPADYERRFPQYAKTVAQQIALHRTLAPPVSTWPWKGNTLLGDDVEPAPLPRLPPTFGRYRIERILGQGGMGAVYLAHDTQLDRAVALKVPRFDKIDPQGIERFYREARIAATFHHPNLCPVYDVGQIDGNHYLTMPYLQGEPLSVLLQRRGRLPAELAALLGARVGRALEVAHQAGVLHRDLKPANIMVLPNEEPVVMDFGLARRERATDPQLSISGFIVGTAAYMPPEQIGGSPDDLGPACDIYSLGAVLYQMLAGRAPFVGSVENILRQTQTTPPPPLRSLVPDIDPNLEAICLRALAKDPAKRFSSAAAFAAELELWLQKQTDTERSAPVPTAVAPTGQKAAHRFLRRAWPWLAGVACIAALLLVFLAIFMRSNPHANPPKADPLPANSRWEGNFRFRPPHGDERHDVTLDITQRQDGSFIGIYATESDKWQWEVAGAVREGQIAWEFTRVLHEAEPRNLVGHAKVTGRLQGDRMDLLYKDEDSIADMTLLRAR